MKKAIPLALVLAFITPATHANEIAGTRVAGQGAVCAEGQGKGVEYNIALRQETSYCFELPVVVPPTPQQVETKAKEQVAQTITEQKNANPVTVVAEETVTAEPQPITEELTKVEVNATTQVVTISPLTEAEKDQVSKDRAVSQARTTAKETASAKAQEDIGTEHCVNWSAQGQSGTECDLEPIPAEQEEVDDWWNIFTDTFIDWFALLSMWRWNW